MQSFNCNFPKITLRNNTDLCFGQYQNSKVKVIIFTERIRAVNSLWNPSFASYGRALGRGMQPLFMLRGMFGRVILPCTNRLSSKFHDVTVLTRELVEKLFTLSLTGACKLARVYSISCLVIYKVFRNCYIKEISS